MPMQLASLSYSDSAVSLSGLRSRSKTRVVLVCCIFSLLVAFVPVARACYRVELNYSEGWNVYNTMTLVNHLPLYPERYGWTTVNYPMLWFAILAQLHRVTHEYLFTARALSLIGLAGTSVLAGAVVRVLGASRQAALLAGFYCLALFATDADAYVGVDDPQMFAQIFFLAGLLLYLWRRYDFLAISGAALLFVVGGSIKHNPVDIPLAVLIDLGIAAPRRALWFLLNVLGLAAVSVALNVHFGGPYFLAQLLIPRSWSLGKVLLTQMVVLGPLLVPFLAAVYAAYLLRRDRQLRIASILLATSFLLGSYFAGGRGVSINALFSVLIAIAILTGLLWERLWNPEGMQDGGERLRWPSAASGRRLDAPGYAEWAPALLFAWLLIPWLLVPAISSGFDRDQWEPLRRLRETATAQRRFDSEVARLRSLPGPAICESLLRCYFAGKPYVLDPFNTARLIQLGKVDPGPIVEDLRKRRFAAVQFDDTDPQAHSERFDPAIEAAIQANYAPTTVDQEVAIYAPRTAPR
jgi:hypothetical protein